MVGGMAAGWLTEGGDMVQKEVWWSDMRLVRNVVWWLSEVDDSILVMDGSEDGGVVKVGLRVDDGRSAAGGGVVGFGGDEGGLGVVVAAAGCWP
ncbi:hypothetical protein Tco_1195806 [Tanacetum coccineum]|uniref:Uncharacterized protein n=1 Tax=Tanacetum coccineum TaxID=301880 RepID=A0ABQ5J8K5_9ASTR